MSEKPPQPDEQAYPMRTLGCAGIFFSGVILILAIFTALQMRPDSTPAAAAIVSATPIIVPMASDTDQTQAFAGKLQALATPVLAPPVIPNEIDRRPIPSEAMADYQHLMSVSPPAHDYFATAKRLGGFELGPRALSSQSMSVGDRRTFQTAAGPREAELVYLTDTVSYWVEFGLPSQTEAIAAAAQVLEARYLPALQTTFGREWSPGMDGDPHISVLHTVGSPDDFELGYFSDENEYPQTLFVHSNEREMIYLNMSRLEVGTDLYFGTLVHELQHLAQWNLDANEQVWMNEGLSQLAETMAGLDTVKAAPYLEHPTVRLDRWSTAPGEVYAHYAAAYLYLRYLQQRAGERAIRELVRLPGNGLAAVSTILEAYLPDRTLPQFSLDWAVANYLDNRGAQGPWGYDEIGLPSPALATRARRLPFSTLNELDQYAVDYIDLDLSGPVRLTFVGDTVTPLIDSPPPQSERFWYAALDNSSAPSLTTEVSVPSLEEAALNFDLWYDLEPNWDVAYLSASADGGQTWQILPGQNAVTGPYGPAWNGRSADISGNQAGWIHESVSLGAYAGQTVLLRFDLLSDFEGPSRGLALANVSLDMGPESTLELAWQANGFTETGWLLPQLWGVRLIRRGETDEVIELTPDETGLAQLDTSLGAEGGIVVVMPLSAPSELPVRYWLGVESVSDTP